jgi:flagellar hook-associated protein 2
MATINFSGIGSGLDFSKLTDAIVSERSRPISLLQSKNSENTKRSDALKALNAKLAALTSAAEALTDRDLGTRKLSSTTDSKVASVTNTTDAELGSVSVNVSRLASNLVQASGVYASKTSTVLASGATTATFELRKGGATTGEAITINSDNNSLTGLRDAINKADAGITASIVDVNGSGTSFKLVLNSTSTGAAGRVELVETTATGTGASLNVASVNPPGATTDFSTLDASFSLNGLPLTRSSNSVADAVTGLTITLKSAGDTTITTTASSSDISDKLTNYVRAYNDVQDLIAAQYTKDGQGRPSGVLAGDSTLRTIQRQIRDAVGGNSTTNGGVYKNLAEIGVVRDTNGKLSLDTTTLNQKLSSSLGDVQALLSGKTESQKGIAHQLKDANSKLSDDITGLVKQAIDGYKDSIKRTDRNIQDQFARLNNLRESLTRQFAVADAAINQLNGQNTTLTNVLNSLKPKTS